MTLITRGLRASCTYKGYNLPSQASSPKKHHFSPSFSPRSTTRPFQMSRQDRAINDVRDLFGVRRSSQTTADAERQISELFSDIHIHAGSKTPGGDSAIGFSDDEDERKTGKSYDKNRNNLQNIERHLSMKKTIRKKMTRDLQRAFIEDPNHEFTNEKNPDANLLDLLRSQDAESGQRYEEREKKLGFWKKLTMKKAKR